MNKSTLTLGYAKLWLQLWSLVCQEGELAHYQELVGALLELARSYLLFLPAVLLTSAALPALLHWAIAAVQLKESEPVSHAAAFLSAVMAPPPALTASTLWQVCPGAVHAETYGLQWTGVLFNAGCVLCEAL